MLFYISFDGKIGSSRSYQKEAFNTAVQNGLIYYSYNKNGYVFDLQKCDKFGNTYLLKRDDQTLSGILTERSDIEVLSTENHIGTAVIGSVLDVCDSDSVAESQPNKVAEYNYCVEYAGNVVEILKGDRIWYDQNGKIMIGWHGSYSPPHGM